MRWYATPDLASAPKSKSQQFGQFMEKAAQLSLQAAKLNDSGDYLAAESALEGALSLRARAVAGYTQEEGKAPADYSLVTAQMQASLAYSKTALHKHEEANDLYKHCLPVIEAYMKDERDWSVILMNYAECQMAMQKPHDAIEACNRALANLKRHPVHEADELKAIALSNLSGYYAAAKKFEEAKPHAAQALKIFIKKLGRSAKPTKEAWNNYYCLLKELGQDEEAADLETEWRAAAEGVNSKQAEKLNDKQVEDIRRRVEERLHKPKRAEPSGTTKDPTFFRDELTQFINQWRESGFDIEDPAHATTLQKEVSALKRGEKHAANVLSRETERLANVAAQHGESWEALLKELEDIQEMTAQIDSTLSDEKIAAHEAHMADIKAKKKPQGPSKELLQEIEEIKVKKAENARKKAEADRLAAEAAAKAAAEAAAKGKKGKKGR